LTRTWATIVSLAGSTVLLAFPAHGQDSPSLADAARQSRLQKQQKDAQASPTQDKDSPAGINDPQPAKTPRVITNDDIPEHVGSNLTPARSPETPSPTCAQPGSDARKISADQWKAQIQAQKNEIATLQREIEAVTASIHFPENCLPRTCAQRNERQLQKENRVEIMKGQLEQQQRRLEEMQESARRQGYGSAVYDP